MPSDHPIELKPPEKKKRGRKPKSLTHPIMKFKIVQGQFVIEFEGEQQQEQQQEQQAFLMP